MSSPPIDDSVGEVHLRASPGPSPGPAHRTLADARMTGVLLAHANIEEGTRAVQSGTGFPNADQNLAGVSSPFQWNRPPERCTLSTASLGMRRFHPPQARPPCRSGASGTWGHPVMILRDPQTGVSAQLSASQISKLGHHTKRKRRTQKAPSSSRGSGGQSRPFQSCLAGNRPEPQGPLEEVGWDSIPLSTLPRLPMQPLPRRPAVGARATWRG